MKEIIFDCDPGVDDALALALAIASPELTVRAVTCVAGNRPLKTTSHNARRLLDLFGAEHIPVYAGAARPLAYPEPRCNMTHGEDGLGGVPLTAKGSVAAEHAVDAIFQALAGPEAGDRKIVAVGPLTNLALAEIKNPGLLSRADEILIMGGTAFTAGNVNPAAEFNFWCDPLAAQVVLSSGAALRIFGLDVTGKAAMNQPFLSGLAASSSRSARKLAEMLKVYGEIDPLLHDACPVAFLLDPGLFRGETGYMLVDWAPGVGEGRSYFWSDASKPAASNVTVMTDVDSGRLLSVIERRLALLP